MSARARELSVARAIPSAVDLAERVAELEADFDRLLGVVEGLVAMMRRSQDLMAEHLGVAAADPVQERPALRLVHDAKGAAQR